MLLLLDGLSGWAMNQISVRLPTAAPSDTSSTPEQGRCSHGNQETDRQTIEDKQLLFLSNKTGSCSNHVIALLFCCGFYKMSPRFPQHRETINIIKSVNSSTISKHSFMPLCLKIKHKGILFQNSTQVVHKNYIWRLTMWEGLQCVHSVIYFMMSPQTINCGPSR